MPKRPNPELLTILGEEGLALLAEAFGGTRLFVPMKLPDDHEIVQAIGRDAASALSNRCSPDYIKVPLAREERAKRHRAAGKSNAQIARALGMTETGVETLFRRLGQAKVALPKP